MVTAVTATQLVGTIATALMVIAMLYLTLMGIRADKDEATEADTE
jgi:hypothetical protein